MCVCVKLFVRVQIWWTVAQFLRNVIPLQLTLEVTHNSSQSEKFAEYFLSIIRLSH